MKKKFLLLSSSILLCCTFISCNLKDAITGANTNDTSTTTNENTTNENDNKSVIINDANAENTDSNMDTATSTDLTNTTSSIDDKNGSTLTTTDYTSTTNTTTNDTTTYYIDTTVPVTDNAFTTALTNKLYTSPDSSDNFIVIPEEFGVNSATIDEETGVLKVVFNEDFTSALPLGTSSESGLISAIVNTYGYNYGLDKVAIYFGDTLYTGLKGELPEGYYTVNTEDAIKLN